MVGTQSASAYGLNHKVADVSATCLFTRSTVTLMLQPNAVAGDDASYTTSKCVRVLYTSAGC